MRILLLCGSLGRMSANRAALDVVRSDLERRGIEVTDGDVFATVPALNPDLVDTPPPAVVELRRLIAAADAVIIAAPEYAGGLAGSVKNALDWVVGSGELYGKHVGILCAGTSGGEHARLQLAQTLYWQGARPVADLGIAAPRTKSDADGTITDPATLAALHEFTDDVLLGTPRVA